MSAVEGCGDRATQPGEPSLEGRMASPQPNEGLVALAIDGDVLGGRLFVWADTLALGLIEMADRFDAMDPMIVIAAGETPGRVLREIGAQLAQGVIDYGGPS